ncbi:histidine kinase [Flavobacteriaceae bacterium S0825]|uniref:sensor histidine kinase n=1 Tax=Gaetbulibacter sp. S0825 TaxID=2720084 RepID=UPI001FCC8B31|nr:histidine kinase [Gaetbulibacter sp. S0825]MCK0109556.1 histidine kinase [Flavobacteriaceae bacterium S0825]
MVQASEHLVSTSAERSLLIYMIAVLVIVTGLVILFFMVFQKRKNQMLLDKIKREREFEEELVKTQTEIQEQTLKNIGQELHDNVGQLLSVANMQLSLVASLAKDTVKNKVDDTKRVISEAIKEVRGLSKVLNSEVILNFGLKESIQNEIDRLNKLKSISSKLTIVGEVKELHNKDAIILFRIFQEFLSNTIKYAEAQNFDVNLRYLEDCLIITAKDDGKGFDIETIKKGSGLINIKDRSRLINTKFKLISKKNEGASLELTYPFNKINQTT